MRRFQPSTLSNTGRGNMRAYGAQTMQRSWQHGSGYGYGGATTDALLQGAGMLFGTALSASQQAKAAKEAAELAKQQSKEAAEVAKAQAAAAAAAAVAESEASAVGARTQQTLIYAVVGIAAVGAIGFGIYKFQQSRSA